MDIILGKDRRRWPIEEKRRIVIETFEPDTSVHGVAKRHGINPGMLFAWRKQFRKELGFAVPEAASLSFTPVVVAPDPSTTVSSGSPAVGAIEVEFPNGARLRITGAVERTTVAAAIGALLSMPRQ